jgi:glycine dehydrogenase
VPGRAAALLAAAAAAGYDLGVRPASTAALHPGDADHVGSRSTRPPRSPTSRRLGGSRARGGTEDGAACARARRLPARRHGDRPGIPPALHRTSEFLTDPRFHAYRSETELMRWLRQLKAKDIALDRSMIPLGSCTMKLNAAAEMEAVTWPAFADLHPFAPLERSAGTRRLIADLEEWLAEITGYDAVSLQPNSGAPGRAGGAARDPRLPPGPGRGPPRRLPDPVLGARHQRRLGGDGRDAGAWSSPATTTATSTSTTSSAWSPSTPTGWRR